ncbi:MAG: TraR/DksA C4-type zinc finger protein [Bdellovibrionales bacterium]|nr:TraR/DksA C4-type zinc finger protein [Bdellovibrionales bacterium]
MRKSVVNKFKRVFEEERRQILYNDRILRPDFNVNDDDRPDEVDQAATDAEQAMRMRLRNRELLYIKKIDQALTRIEEGIFGECNSCGEDIELRRLEARPTATLCVSCKEEEERAEVLTASGRRHKSLGDTLHSVHA